MTPSLILGSFVFPLVLGLILLASLRLRRIKGTPRRAQASGVGLMLAIVVAVSFFKEAGLPSMPPAERWHWLPLVVLAAAAWSMLLAMVVGKKIGGRLVLAVIAGIIAGIVQSYPGHGLQEKVILGACTTAMILLIGSAGDRPGVSMCATIAIVLGGTSVLAVESGFPSLAIIAASASAYMLAVPLVGRGTPGMLVDRSSTVVIGTLVVAIAACGMAYGRYSHVDTWHWMLVAASPGVLLLNATPLVAGMRQPVRRLVSIGLFSLPVIAGVLLAIMGGNGPAAG